MLSCTRCGLQSADWVHWYESIWSKIPFCEEVVPDSEREKLPIFVLDSCGSRSLLVGMGGFEDDMDITVGRSIKRKEPESPDHDRWVNTSVFVKVFVLCDVGLVFGMCLLFFFNGYVWVCFTKKCGFSFYFLLFLENLRDIAVAPKRNQMSEMPKSIWWFWNEVWKWMTIRNFSKLWGISDIKGLLLIFFHRIWSNLSFICLHYKKEDFYNMHLGAYCRIDLAECVKKVNELLQRQPSLFLGFQDFLPKGCDAKDSFIYTEKHNYNYKDALDFVQKIKVILGLYYNWCT